MERSTRKNGLINLLALLLVAAAGFAVAHLANSIAGQVSMIFVAIGALVAGVSWFQMRLEENERLEKLEVDELARTKGASTIFQSKEAEIFPAQRSREQFERFIVPGITIVLLVLEGIGAFFTWRSLVKAPETGLQQPFVALSLFALFALGLFLLGKFSATIARLENHRLLRPGASWVLLSAYLCFVVALGIAGGQADFPKADYYIARGLAALLALIAIETLINLILEIYRPRVKGKTARPLYESRLVGLLAQPEGLITTAAQALDYQFGFKVSETWFYRFFEKRLFLLLLIQVGILLLSTTIVFIEPGEQALLEHLGTPATGKNVLGPGPHLKWPWPIDQVHRYRTDRIQSFNVGFTPDPELEKSPVVLWTVVHTREEVNFLVANRDQNATQNTNQVTGKRIPPVSLLTVSIPVQFQISDLTLWAYKHQDGPKLLEELATREVVRYLAGADLNEIMARERGAAADTLRERIQAAADAQALGARILFVGVQDIHPPVKVAPEYEKVVGALHTRQAARLAAQADAIKANALASAAATNMINVAAAGRTTRDIERFARAALFTNQIPAYRAAPSIYMQRAYLETFARATANARKFVLLTTNTTEVLQLDLHETIREDLLNLNVQPKK